MLRLSVEPRGGLLFGMASCAGDKTCRNRRNALHGCIHTSPAERTECRDPMA
jgi:hypothetical protein